MSDRKHIEYCIKLGNTLVENKIQNNAKNYNEYYTPINNYSDKPKENDFRSRLKNWNS